MSGSFLGRGIYHTNKEPIGLNDGILANARIVGIDPGKERRLKEVYNKADTFL